MALRACLSRAAPTAKASFCAASIHTPQPRIVSTFAGVSRIHTAVARQRGTPRGLLLCRDVAPPTRPSTFATTRRHYATEPNSGGSSGPEGPSSKTRDRFAIGPFNSRAALLFVITAAGLLLYFRHEKQKVEERKRQETAQAKVGRPKIGGGFELVMPTTNAPASSSSSSSSAAADVEARRFVADDLKGAFSLVYFGFTNCPDICPEELDKMTQVVDRIDKLHGPVINPVFITCDPARDSLSATHTYVSEFHPRMVGLTGSYDAIKQACKAYRVYFSTPPGADPNSDYLVDHSIFFYLMDPEGKFVDAFGRSVNEKETYDKVLGYIEQWKRVGNPIGTADAKARVAADEARRIAYDRL